MSDLTHRITVLEVKQQTIEGSIKDLQQSSSDLQRSLEGIQQQLNQIKWIATGAVAVLLLKSGDLKTLISLLPF